MKLLQFQQKVEAIAKDSQNPFFKSNYLSLNGLLDAIKPLLNELELVLLQPLTNVDGRPAITTKLLDGDKVLLESTITLPDLQDPQKVGSAISYYRRYSIQSMLLLQAEDNDAEGVLRPTIQVPTTTPIKPAYQKSAYTPYKPTITKTYTKPVQNNEINIENIPFE